MPATVIVLNGCSSAGKSSAARALQAIAREPFLHVAMDAFLAMLPERVWADPQGIRFDQRMIDGHPIVDIETGPAFDRAMQGMRRAIGALWAEGNNCIVDDVMLLPADQQDYRATIDPGALRFVALHASLPLLEEREIARGDRVHGLARGQIGRVHSGREYDLEITVDGMTPVQCAQRIAERFDLA